MILVTVGTQLGFDRLVRAVDLIAGNLPHPVFIQTGRGTYVPQHCQSKNSLSPQEFDNLAQGACLIVSHAGIGSVLTAQRLAKPVVIVPRRAALGEHRNDHQLATARELQGRPGIIVALEEGDLHGAIEAGLRTPIEASSVPAALAQLKKTVASFIASGSL